MVNLQNARMPKTNHTPTPKSPPKKHPKLATCELGVTLWS